MYRYQQAVPALIRSYAHDAAPAIMHSKHHGQTFAVVQVFSRCYICVRKPQKLCTFICSINQMLSQMLIKSWAFHLCENSFSPCVGSRACRQTNIDGKNMVSRKLDVTVCEQWTGGAGLRMHECHAQRLTFCQEQELDLKNVASSTPCQPPGTHFLLTFRKLLIPVHSENDSRVYFLINCAYHRLLLALLDVAYSGALHLI